METIKNIIFDLGGVLLDIDFNKTKQAFEKLGVKNFDGFYTKESANELFELLETGDISNEDFYTEIQKHCHPGTNFLQIQEAWNEILVKFRNISVASLSALQKKYNLYLLSNTNSIHYTAFSKMFSRENNGVVFDSLFQKAYYSHQIHRRKPYPDTYSFVLHDAGIRAADTLFIDDSLANINGAKQAGLHTHLLEPSETIERLGLL